MKPEVKHKEKSGKNTYIRRLNHMLLNNECVTEQIKQEIKKKYMKTNEKENMAVQNLWYVAKVVK